MTTTNGNSLKFRRDNRTEAEFAKDIKKGTDHERKLLEAWVELMITKGHIVSYKSNGIDNSGELVSKSDNRADYLITVDGIENKVEIKRNPYNHKMTFKEYDVKSYISSNTKILLFYDVGQGELPSDKSLWTIIEVDKLKLMLANVKRFAGDRKWGNKPILRFYPKDYSLYFGKVEKLYE